MSSPESSPGRSVRARTTPPPPKEFDVMKVFNPVEQNVGVFEPLTSNSSMPKPFPNDVTIVALNDPAHAHLQSFNCGGIFQVVKSKIANSAYSPNNNGNRYVQGGRNNAGGSVNWENAIYVRDVLSNNEQLYVIFVGGPSHNGNFYSNDFGARTKLMSKYLFHAQAGSLIILSLSTNTLFYFFIIIIPTEPGAMFFLQGAKHRGHIGTEASGRLQSIVTSSYGAIWISPVKTSLPTRMLDMSHPNMFSQAFEGCTIQLSDMQAVKTQCSGEECDQQGLVKPDGTVVTSCCCKTMNIFTNVGISVEMIITTSHGNEIEVNNHLSRRMTHVFMITDPIIPGTSLSRIQEHVPAIFRAFSNVIGHVNRNGGFSTVFWMKRGQQIDRSQPVDNTGGGYNRQQQPVYIASDNLTFHLFHLVPTDPARATWAEIYKLKFDTQKLYL